MTPITIIPKECKDKVLCSSFRPISILNADYKINTFKNTLSKRAEKLPILKMRIRLASSEEGRHRIM